MPRMVSFRLNRECRDICVNADKILYVSHYETGASSLHFGKDCFVRVQGDVAEVARKLESAMHDAPPTVPHALAARADFN